MKKLISNFSRRFFLIIQPRRIRKYGLSYIILEILILMCHPKRDRHIRSYLLKNYGDIVEKYFDE